MGSKVFYSLHQGKSFHQHVVHHRLCHRTQQSCNHSTDCSVCSHGHQQVSVLKWKKNIIKRCNESKVVLRCSNVSCGVWKNRSVQASTANMKRFVHENFEHETDSLMHQHTTSWTNFDQAPAWPHALKKYACSTTVLDVFSYLVTLVEQSWKASSIFSSMSGNHSSQLEWMEITTPQLLWPRNWFWHVVCQFFWDSRTWGTIDHGRLL